ncbi:MAG TPA: DUF2190 family protein [Ktedonobacteraceae bacterium]|jgi:hypothetical protein
MAWGNFVLDKGMDAGGAISKCRAVKLSAQETVVQVTASTDIALGIEQFGVSAADIARGKGSSVRWIGVSEWEAGAAVGIGVEVMCDTSGRCIPATGTGNRVKGVCVSDAAVNAGDRCTVLLYIGGGRIL